MLNLNLLNRLAMRVDHRCEVTLGTALVAVLIPVWLAGRTGSVDHIPSSVLQGWFLSIGTGLIMLVATFGPAPGGFWFDLAVIFQANLFFSMLIETAQWVAKALPTKE